MSGYTKLISEATGVTDLGELRELEGIMRDTIFHSTLDWLSEKEFKRGAKKAKKVFDGMRKKP
jgi:hypothetical protein